MKKQLFTITVSVVILGALLGIYYITRDRNIKEQEAAAAVPTATPRPSIVLIEKQKQDLASATIEHAGNEYVFLPAPEELAKSYINWIIVGYEDLSLKNYDIDNIISSLCYLSPSQELENGSSNLSEYGFDNPEVTVTAKYTDGGTDTILIGKPTPSRDYYYVMRQGDDKVYLLTSLISKRFYIDMNLLIDKTLPMVDPGITHVYLKERDKQPIEFAFKGSTSQLQKDLESYGMASLTMSQPYPGRDLYLSYFQESVMTGFEEITLSDLVEIKPMDLSKYGLDDPALTILIEDGYGGRINLTVGDEKEGDSGVIYVMEENIPAVFTMQKSMLANFYGMNAFDFIDRFVAIMKIDSVDSIDVSSSERGRTHHLELNHEPKEENDDGTGISIFNPTVDGKRVQESAFRTFYQRLVGLTYDTEIPLFAPGSAQPLFTATYRLNTGEDDITIRFYKYNDDFYAAQRDDNPIQFVVNKQSVDLMFRTMDDLVAGKLDR